MKKSLHFCAIFILLPIFLSCTGLLPSGNVTTKSPWDNYQSAKSDYEKIVPGVTTVEELNRLGFDPYDIPNIRIMNSTEIINMFMPTPSIKIEDLEPGIQKCITSKSRCTAYQLAPNIVDSKRIGSFWLDLFSFKRDTVTTGWELRGLIAIVDGVVVYRDPAGGRPSISTEEVQKKPLGPLQDVGGIITGTAPVLVR